MKIAIDAMGGDNAPQAVLEGVKLVLPELKRDVELVLYGDEGTIQKGLAELGVRDARVTTAATSEVIGCDEQPTLAIRKKKDSSMVRAIEAVASGEADCVLSAGSTGALLTGATLIIKRLKGVKRPALATVMPTVDACALLLDCGANTDCKSDYLVQFALMGAAYMKRVIGVDNPRVGLLSNGAEEEKGNELTKETHQRLKTAPVNFTGNCEARDVLGGAFDVVVCDGFDGNIVLKGTEGAAGLIMDLLKQALMSSLRTKIGALICKPAFRLLKKKLDYTEYGGAPLLGVNGGVIKAHGSSNGKAFRSAILQAEKLISSDVTRLLGAEIAQYDLEEKVAERAEGGNAPGVRFSTSRAGRDED
ncbi:MAG: phosphate acyltransferase PlsX [Clostridiales bacterium]|nr:phosphate acyltransferase PlsX [Clostridiales bacterium]